MAFWIIMFLFELILPLCMLGFGYYSIHHTPKQINSFIGYRTTNSMKNKETWYFAHQYIGKLWFKLGWIILIPTLIIMLFTIHKSIHIISLVVLILFIIQLIFMLYPVFLTEQALKNTFTEKGQRKSQPKA